jgi:hypothetical protein
VYTLYRSVMGLLLFVVLGEQKFTPWLIFRYPFNWSFCTVEKTVTGLQSLQCPACGILGTEKSRKPFRLPDS